MQVLSLQVISSLFSNLMLNVGSLTHFSFPGKQKGKKEETKQASKERKRHTSHKPQLLHTSPIWQSSTPRAKG
jgi:hypothetical protein